VQWSDYVKGMLVNLNPQSWPDSLLSLRKKRKKNAAASTEETPAMALSVPVPTNGSTASSIHPGPDEELFVAERAPDFMVVNPAPLTVDVLPSGAEMEPANSVIRLAAPLAAHKTAHKLAPLSMSTFMPSLDQVMVKIRETFQDFLQPSPPPPPPPRPLPDPTLFFVSVTERSVGIGNRIGNQARGAFGAQVLKGVRLKVVLSLQLWANSMEDVDKAVQDLIERLLAARDVLRGKGVLRLGLKSIDASEASDTNIWRQSADFTVLYELPYADTDGAESLIAQIPVNINSEFNETTTLTDEMAAKPDYRQRSNSTPQASAICQQAEPRQAIRQRQRFTSSFRP
jgi:hypothetical protein